MDTETVVMGPFLQDRVLILVPHMDDAVLGCGGTLATLRPPALKLVYCTDGRGSMTKEERATLIDTEQDIGRIRRKETIAALGTLGVSQDQAVFLPFEEWKLGQAQEGLRQALERIVREFDPTVILCPSRYDKHVDHLALNRAAHAIRQSRETSVTLFEYFVYYHWKLLPSGDIRTYIQPARLARVDIRAVSALKRKALDQFVSQVTPYYAWQHKPVLSDALLTESAAGPELFMRADRNLKDRDVLTIPPAIVRLLNWLEPILKNSKEALLRIVFNLRRTGRDRAA